MAILSVLLSAIPGNAQLPPDAEIAAILESRVQDGMPVGIVVGVVENDGSTRIVYAGGAGEGARALGPETVFEIGSITKVFTGTLLADMARDGAVRLADPVGAYLPEGVRVPSRGGREITLLDLATHRSGLPRLPSGFSPADATNPYADYTVEQMYRFLSGYELPRDIGERFEYSNLGVGLLGHALARAAGTSYEALVRERILEPLGMERTGIELTDPMRARMARGHDARGEPVPLWDIRTLEGAGALRSDVMDMLRFLRANVGEPTSALDASMRAAQVARRATDDDRPDPASGTGEPGVGLNWLTAPAGDSVVIWHNGGTGGFRSFIGFDPVREIGVVVLSNSTESIDDIGMHLLDSSIPLMEVARGSMPGWGVIVLVGGFAIGAVTLELLGRRRARAA